MIKILNAADCCGCTACASVCAHNAIQMKPDDLGFLYPEVDTNKCTNCGLCDKVCQFHANYDKSNNLPIPNAYGARHKNMQEVETSRSGAAFIAISDWILDQGGVVYGAGYTDHFRVVHKRATTRLERDEFKGSKYVQSDLVGIFCQVKQDLRNGLKVLFSGTPCQTAGLRAYIGQKTQEQLYLVDIICHGVPSPKLWEDNICYIERHNAPITRLDFRNKQKFGWDKHIETYYFTDKEPVDSDLFTKAFCRNLSLRRCCGICPFSNTHRPSDITIGDFWGWEKCNAEANADDKGLSLLLVNSKKGEVLFSFAKSDLNVFPVDIINCMQPNLRNPSIIHPKHKKFEQDYVQEGLEYVFANLDHYDRPILVKRVYQELKQIAKQLQK